MKRASDRVRVRPEVDARIHPREREFRLGESAQPPPKTTVNPRSHLSVQEVNPRSHLNESAVLRG
jgi:hypothetical protein